MGTRAALIRRALEAGCDSIEHASYLDDETIRLFKAKGAWLVPTEMAPIAALASARAGLLPPAILPKAERAAADMFANTVMGSRNVFEACGRVGAEFEPSIVADVWLDLFSARDITAIPHARPRAVAAAS